MSPTKIILIGFILVVVGVIIPFSIILEILPSTFFLSFVAYMSSIGGLLLGIIGAALYHREDEREDFWRK
jgi:membrane associated rhomboid family serine protease